MHAAYNAEGCSNQSPSRSRARSVRISTWLGECRRQNAPEGRNVRQTKPPFSVVYYKYIFALLSLHNPVVFCFELCVFCGSRCVMLSFNQWFTSLKINVLLGISRHISRHLVPR